MWFKALELLGSLSLLIVLHELGHFLAAKYFKVRVEKFYLFFDFMFPLPDVLNFSLFKKKIGETEYGIGWFPMGGYVQMSGIMDETMDKEALAKPVQPYEFRAKPAWQRLIILLGGIIVNVLLAFVIYAGMSYTWGDDYLPMENVPYGISVDSLGRSIGLEDGDYITHVEGEEVVNFEKTRINMILNLAENITVKRGTESFEITGLNDTLYAQMLKQKKQLFGLRMPSLVGELVDSSTYKNAGGKKGDRILFINNEKVDFYAEVLEVKKKYKNQTIPVVYKRDNQIDTLIVKMNDNASFGYFAPEIKEVFDIKHRDYTFLQAIVSGPVKTYQTLDDYLKQFKLIFNKTIKGFTEIGGFAAIGKMFPKKDQFTWQIFWKLTAFLSVMLAFLNFLPIPGLDGGHSVFVIYEMIVGKPANQKFMEYTQMVGMAILFGLLIYANGNDIFKAIFGS